ncbi:hypothetical protein AB0756_39890 [Tolypothrix campylonemoides VB511288_2]|uniref:Uncharacterized protein n=3 Tax=Nostocales TaxID=1161 RepID=A0A0C1RL04_9CYAN
MFICDQDLKEYLEGWAAAEGRTVSNILERCAVAIRRDREKGLIPSSPNPGEGITSHLAGITSEELAQIKKFFDLLSSDRERSNVSFSLLSRILDIEPEKLHALYELIEKYRKEVPTEKPN